MNVLTAQRSLGRVGGMEALTGTRAAVPTDGDTSSGLPSRPRGSPRTSAEVPTSPYLWLGQFRGLECLGSLTVLTF